MTSPNRFAPRSPEDRPFDPERVDVYQSLRHVHGEASPGVVEWELYPGASIRATHISESEVRRGNVKIIRHMDGQEIGGVRVPLDFPATGQLRHLSEEGGEIRASGGGHADLTAFVEGIVRTGHDGLAAEHELRSSMSDVTDMSTHSGGYGLDEDGGMGIGTP